MAYLLTTGSKIRLPESGKRSDRPNGHSTAVRAARQVVGLSLLLACALACTAFGPFVISDGGYPPLRLDPDSVQLLAQSKKPPPLSAKAALVMDLDANQVLYALRADEKVLPASTVKIMTALVTLQRSDLDDVVQVSAGAAATEGSRMGLAQGESLTVKELLYGLLLPSGNDAAVALAEHVASNEGAFVDLMNETAADLGMRGTHFTSPHGLGDSGETISATDLVSVTRAALAYPVFSEIVATAESNVAGHKLVNTNELLTTFAGADGVKTGTTDEAGECLVASVTRDGHRLLVVLLGSQDRYGEARALLNWANQGWQWRGVELPDNALAWEGSTSGTRRRLRTEDSQEAFLAVWQWPLVQVSRTLTATVPPTVTVPVGTLTLSLSGSPLAQLPLGVWTSP
jgi:serine-type D-Ala-D-Ala carboxypeptidase (penicillin-binding protein 5/6)